MTEIAQHYINLVTVVKHLKHTYGLQHSIYGGQFNPKSASEEQAAMEKQKSGLKTQLLYLISQKKKLSKYECFSQFCLVQ